MLTKKLKNKILILLSSLFFCTNIWAQELVIWTSNEGAAKVINSVKEDFEKKYQVKVVVEVLNKDLTSLFKTAALTGKGPDILLWAHDVSGELAQSGLIEPLDETPFLKNNLLPVSLKAFHYKGRLYGYPFAVESIVLFYNKDLVKNPPKSFEEIEQISHKIKNSKEAASGLYGFLYDFKNFFFSFPILNANGGYIFKETEGGLNPKDVGINNQGFIDGLTYLQGLTKNKIIPTSTDRGVAFLNFKTNKLLFTIDGPWAIKELNESHVHYGISTLPLFKNKISRPFVGVQGFMIRRSSKEKLLAKEFIEKYLMGKTSMENFYKFDNRLPARMDVLDLLALSNEQVKVLKESVASGIPMPNIPQMGSVWGAMGKAFSLSLEQGLDPKKSLDQVIGQVQ